MKKKLFATLLILGGAFALLVANGDLSPIAADEGNVGGLMSIDLGDL